MKKSFLKSFIGILLALFCQYSYAQTRRVTGTVTAKDDGLPMPGVSVVVKGTRTGVQTGLDGKFAVSVPSSGGTLIFSFIGYTALEVPIGSDNVINAVLKTDSRLLSEVVVTGSGVATSKAKLGIAVESVSAAQLPSAPTASIDQALVGKIPGAQISSVNGNPGQQVNIVLRGINSIQAGTRPLILIDGIQVGGTDLNSIDLANIDHVEIVQGAAGATIYGAQGANGVIQLFTKKGKPGQMHVDISSNASVNKLINQGDVHKARLLSLVTDAAGNVIGAATKTPLQFDPELSYYPENVTWNSLDPTNNNNKPYTNLTYHDHYKEFFKNANTYNNSISIYGGSQKVDYNISGSNTRQNTTFKNNGDYKRYNLSANVGIELFKGLKFRNNTQLIYTQNNLLDQTGRGILYSLNNSRPFADYNYKDPDGNYGAYFGDAVGVNGFNPNYNTQYTHSKIGKQDLLQNFSLNYAFPKFVELDAKYGINYSTSHNVYLVDPQDNNANTGYTDDYLTNYYGAQTITQTGETTDDYSSTVFQNFIGTATIHTDFQNDFHLGIPLKTSTQISYDYRKNLYKDFITYGADAPSYTPFNSSNYLVFKTVYDYVEPFITYGYLINQKFDYGEYGGISGGLRSDYSSAFGRGSKPFTFPRADAYLRLSSFPFWKDKGIGNVLTEVKFRGAYGEAGIQPGPFQRYVTLNTKNVGGTSAFYLDPNQPNPDLNVEVSKETEIGTDIAIAGLNNSSWLQNFVVSVTWWTRKTDNAIYRVDAAPSTGVGSIVQNAFGLKSNGIQAAINFTGYKGSKFKWDFTANFGHSNSIISSVVGQPVVVTSAAGSSNYILKAGQKIGQLYGYLMLHAVNEKAPDGTPFIPVAQQGTYVVASNGWVVDKNTKQPYVTSSQYSFGDPNPKFNMSFINNFSYGNLLNFNFQVDWVYGSHVYNQTKEWMYRDGISGDYDKPITINGETGAWTAFYRGVYAQVSRNGTKNYFYEDASFARLRNISLSVNLNALFHTGSVKKLQLVFTGRNLFTITNYTGYDPEISSGTGNSSFDRGVDHNTIPNIKTYQLGLNIGL